MLRYSSTNTNNVFTQSIIEICECCGLPVADVHLSEVLTKAPQLGAFTYTIKDALEADYTILLRPARTAEIKTARFNAGMLTASSAESTESLRYKLRSERMCSSSTSVGLDATSNEYCYRVATSADTASFKGPRSAEFNSNFQSKFNPKPDETLDGLKLGMDRLGNPIRILSESKLIGGVATDVFYGSYEKEWYRHLDSAEKLTTLTASFTKAESTSIKDYKFKDSFLLDTTSSYYTNNYSINFDGVNDYIALGDVTTSETLHITEAQFDSHGLSVNAWVYIGASGSTVNPILTIGRTHDDFRGYAVEISDDFKLQMHLYGVYGRSNTSGVTDFNRLSVKQSGSIAPLTAYEDSWMMCTFIYSEYDPSTWNIYLNGKQVSTQYTGHSNHTNLNLTYDGASSIGKLGIATAASESYFNGYINNIGIWKGVLNAKHVAGLWNDGNPPFAVTASAGYTGGQTLAALKYYWPMDEGAGLRVTNEIAANWGTLTNGAAWTTISPIS